VIDHLTHIGRDGTSRLDRIRQKGRAGGAALHISIKRASF
jgi:hypothetical protein